MGWNELFRSHRSEDFTIATNAGRHSRSGHGVGFSGPTMLQSIADFFCLIWYLIRALFMSRESLEREIAEMRRQIAALEAEAARAKIEHEDEGQSKQR